jgi:hypothetical protein
MLRIIDNGNGFKAEALQRIQCFIDNMIAGLPNQLDLIENKGLGGLGLENALMRLYLFYEGRIAFSIRNLEEGMELTIVVSQKEEGLQDV